MAITLIRTKKVVLKKQIQQLKKTKIYFKEIKKE